MSNPERHPEGFEPRYCDGCPKIDKMAGDIEAIKDWALGSLKTGNMGIEQRIDDRYGKRISHLEWWNSGMKWTIVFILTSIVAIACAIIGK